MTGDIVIDFTALLFDTLGYTRDEFVSIGRDDPAGIFHTAVMQPTLAAAYVGQLPATANVYFGVNPTRGPARQSAGRGKEADVTRLAALWCDLDVKPGACKNLDTAQAIVDDLSAILGTRPSVIVNSAHGLHAYWPVSAPPIRDGDIGTARALLRRWGRLVAAVADRHGAERDNVFDLARVPGTTNNRAKPS
jgi:hypothetical protein